MTKKAFGFIVLVVAAGALSWMYSSQLGASAETYITVPIERGSVSTVVNATGTVNPLLTVDVASQLSGRIAEVLVTFNDTVEAGQTLARLDPEIYAARVSEATAALKIARINVEMQRASLVRARAAFANAKAGRVMADAQLASLQARFVDTSKQLERKLSLRRGSIASESEIGRAQAQRDSELADIQAAVAQVQMKADAIEIAEAEVGIAEANLRNAEAVVEQKQAALEQAQLDLDRTEIKTPIAGTVIKRDINPGQTVAVSLKAETLFKIAQDLSQIEVHGKVDEADIGRLREGQSTTFTVDAFPDQKFTGQVKQVRKAAEVVQNVVTYTVIVAAENPDRLLFPGMTANLRIVISQTTNDMKVPNQALRYKPPSSSAETAGEQTLWVLDNSGNPSPIKVAVGATDGIATHVRSEQLEEGQRVIIGTSTLGGSAREPGLRLGL